MKTVRCVPWLDMVRHHVRAVPIGPRFNFPTCQRCKGVMVDAIEIVHENAKQVWVRGKHSGYRDEWTAEWHAHQGRQEDVVRVDFESPWDEEDLRRALGSMVMFPADSQMDAT
jgi:hypothetical protein